MKIYFDLGTSYPDSAPYFRLKNLSPDYMDNNFLDRMENLMRERGEENLGAMMLYEMCDIVKEAMTDINDKVLEKLDAIEEAKREDTGLKTTVASKHVNFTPVTAETFKVWCDEYKERVRIEKEAYKTDFDNKLTGRQLFEKNKNAFEDLTLEDDSVPDSTKQEESKEEVVDDDEDEAFVYDRALYEGAGDEDEDIDFD